MIGTLYLIRHGSTEGDGKRRYKGSLDVPLSAAGEEEMKRTAEYLGSALDETGQKLSAVYCSRLQRSRRSAEILAETFGLTPIVIDALRERNFGLWEGMTFEEIEERWPETFRAWANDPLNHSPMEGETTMEVSRRVDAAIDEILGSHDGGAIAIVAHGGVNRSVLCRFTGVPLSNIFRIEQDHGAMSIIEFSAGHPVVKLLNYRGY